MATRGRRSAEAAGEASIPPDLLVFLFLERPSVGNLKLLWVGSGAAL
jgi:hypothetical protein